MNHPPNLGLCWWLKVRRHKGALNPCSQRQQKEAQAGAEINLAQRYFIFCFAFDFVQILELNENLYKTEFYM
jgi:hypothetical protein